MIQINFGRNKKCMLPLKPLINGTLSDYETTGKKTQPVIYYFALKLKLDNIWFRVIYIRRSCQNT